MVWIISRFKDNGTPAIGLSATITIYDLSDNSVVVNGVAMNEIAAGSYKYDFSSYDDTKDYLIHTDGSATLSDLDRYHEAVSMGARIDDMNSDVEDILEDTGTTLPATLNTINTNVLKMIGIQGEWLVVEWSFTEQNNTQIESWQYDSEVNWNTHDKSTGLLNHWTQTTTFSDGKPTTAYVKREDT